MSNEELSDQQAQNFRAVYQELCNSYRAIDEFRTKLLGLLPLATGTGIFILIMDDDKFRAVEDYLPYIGLFGFFITLGLLFYELLTRLNRQVRVAEPDKISGKIA